jgi:hypothetical protein
VLRSMAPEYEINSESQSSPNSEASFTKSSRGARVKDVVRHIGMIHAKEAKYMRKRPNDSNETRYCLTKDDMDLMGNYLSHTERTF